MNADNLALQGVDYPAILSVGLNGGDPADGHKMADLVDQTTVACPATQIVLGGYSQGAELVRRALTFSKSVARIVAVVTFGDPQNTAAMDSRVDVSRIKVYCHKNDTVCSGAHLTNLLQISAPHYTYGLLDAGDAASFIFSKLKL
ncbi:hypothetical protein SmJEL517_g03181 [Synchytrium microbalum]|uniref:Cutinase n=1 Tax=Synchytrium microbalum TaxID=1806994 RepID=A0A507C7K3_9FUNG|nr:uncharacterized protein SmJEL517_g03181 [Synchytrium microbalum]TPX34044.1 hypothetical protein SmJEL517_g03181 [Synchytrium microbalum]